MTDFSQISVVIHGPVNSTASRHMPEGITKKAINSVRECLPGAKIIISTWEGQFTNDLDYDHLVFNSDPGPNVIAYDTDGMNHKHNDNRQIVAIREGLKQVKTRYAIKLRSDNYLLHSGFVGLQQAYPLRCDEWKLLEERVVVAHRFTKIQSDGYPIVRHLCDFFAYGLTTDLLKMWDIPLLADFKPDESIKNRPQYLEYPNRKLSPEQHFCSRWIQKLAPNAYYPKHHFDCNQQLMKEWECIMANNLVIIEASNLGLGTTPRLKTHRIKANEISHAEWLMHYSEYCAPIFTPPKYQFYFGGYIYRRAKAPLERIKKKLKTKNNFE